MTRCKGHYRNYMDELYSIICEIDRLKPEPEICNVTCPPLGCPRGPCPGICCPNGICDPCCISKMPQCAGPCNPKPLCQPANSCSMNGAPKNCCPSPRSCVPYYNCYGFQ